MRDLLQCRKDIDAIDHKILELIKARLAVADDIAEYKLQRNQSVSDSGREQAKLSALRQEARKLGIPSNFVSDVFKNVFIHTCAVEEHYILNKVNKLQLARDTSVAYLGSIGSYSYLAAQQYLNNFKGDVRSEGCESFSKIVSMVETGACEYGMLPIENSSSGSINEVLDVLQKTKAKLTGELYIPVDHSILTCGNAKLDGITDIYSHPQPVTQCSSWLKELLPNVTVHYTKATSEAMEIVSKLKNPHYAAIGSKLASHLYNLVPLAENISNNIHSFTRFVAVSMNQSFVPESIKAKTSLSFSVQKYQPGSLIKVLNEFSEHHLNLTKLISRPRLDGGNDTWEEIFFADIEANLASSVMQDILENIKPHTSMLKVLGCYPDAGK